MTQDATSSGIAFATLPDNLTSTYPDNIPDAWLLSLAPEIIPVPAFKLCRVAYGRLWIANTSNAPGIVRPSLPGLWGTFPANQEIFPDPNGDEVTGLWRTSAGLLAFTSKSTYLIYPSDGGQGFQSVTISSEHGDIELFVRRVSRSRRRQATAVVDIFTGEYRCWVSLDGSATNNFCFIFDGTGWRSRTDTQAVAACITRDHRDYTLVAGGSGTDAGVWLLDHEQPLYQPLELTTRAATVETAWLSPPESQERRTAYVLYLWLREASSAEITIEVMRDWRNTVIETTSAKRYAGDDIPPFWGTASLGTTSAWKKRRPYWTRAAVYVPSAEVFKFRITGTGDWEFVGIQLDEAPRYAGGARIPP